MTPTVAFLLPRCLSFFCPCCRCCFCHRVINNNNNTLDSSQRDIKAVVRSHNEEHISIILSHETHTHIHTLKHTPPFSQYACTNRHSSSVAYQYDCANVPTSKVSRFLSLTFTGPVCLSQSRGVTATCELDYLFFLVGERFVCRFSRDRQYCVAGLHVRLR